jgi:hypothetical protein
VIGAVDVLQNLALLGGNSVKLRANVLVVAGRRGDAKVLVTPNPEVELEFDNKEESVLELIRRHFRVRWGAEVHAIGWAGVEDVELDGGNGEPWFFFYADQLGELESCEWILPNGDRGNRPKLLRAATCFSRRQPWSQPGWFRQTCLHLSRVVGSVDLDKLRQVRIGPNGTVLEFEIDSRRYYFKTVPQCFSHEALLVEYLAKKWPEMCAPVLPWRQTLRTHITEAIEGQSLYELGKGDYWLPALRDLGEFQCKVMRSVAEFTRLGVRHRPFSEFRAKFTEIVGELVVAQRGLGTELSTGELAAMEVALKRGLEACEILAACGVPDSLVHGDFNGANVYRTPVGGTKLIDWTFTAVEHPFFAIGFPLRAAEEGRRLELAGMRSKLVRAYLEPFERYASREHLERGLEAARKLMWIHVGESQVQYLRFVQNEMPSGMNRIPLLLRRFLKVACEQ